MLQPAPYVPSTPASWYYQPVLLVTLPHVPFLFLLHQSGIFYLHTSVLLRISLHLSAILNHTFSSQLSLPSHPAPAPLIRSLRHWRSINLVVCMYILLGHFFYSICTAYNSWDIYVNKIWCWSSRWETVVGDNSIQIDGVNCLKLYLCFTSVFGSFDCVHWIGS